MNIKALEQKARWIRLEVLNAAEKSGKSHIGGTYSAVELLMVLYYCKVLKFDLKNPHWDKRDRFILSKGHACTALYAIFYDLGIISKTVYNSYGKNGGLGGQLDISYRGVDFNTGSIGHSVGVAAGMALAFKKNSQKSKAFTLIGDSELFEGSIWEAVIFASDNSLNNLIVIVDRNRLMVTDFIEDNAIYKNFVNKMESFSWTVIEIDGHDFRSVLKGFEIAKKSKFPVLVLANTIKGKGVSFMENNPKWHNASLTKEEIELAKKELKDFNV